MVLMLLAFSCRLMANANMAPGNVSGYVFNYYGLAISGAFVGLANGPVTISGTNGYYFLSGLTEGAQTIGCGKAGYNTEWTVINIVPGDTATLNFTLTQPAMVINPLLIEASLNPGEYFATSLNVLNTGTGILNWQAEINYISMPLIYCDYGIALYDTWGDGWNGCSIDVLVNNAVVLDNITLTSGSGPGNFYFPVQPGDQITTQFNPGPFATETYYYIYNGENEQVWFSPAGSPGPPNILPGQLIASCSGGEWITMATLEGMVPPFGGVDNIPTFLNATGTVSGDIFSAQVIFTSNPDVATITVPVSMTIMGDQLAIPENLAVNLINEITGMVSLSWDWNGDSFQFFLVKCDGAIIATTTNQSFTDILKDHGTYCYTVQAVYNEGVSAPAGPQCVEWSNPVLRVNPDDLLGWVWEGFSVNVFTEISNLGEGTLTFSFPEFVALDLLNDPGKEQNKGGSPPAGMLSSNAWKGNEKDCGIGYPVVLGAGGPDNFGYIWIDSDETGGPAFEPLDISTTGTPIFGLSDDNIVGPYAIGFDFYFYGEVKNSFWVNSNGCIGFTSKKITNQNTAIPTYSSVYNDFIAWMWDDLVFRTGISQAFYQTFSDKLIIQFKKYERYNQPNLFIDAEIVLYKNGKIMVFYNNISTALIINSCTIGLQSPDPDIGLQVAFNTTYLHNNLALLFVLPGDFITDVVPAYGTVQEGSAQVVTITYDSEEYLPGPYTQELYLETNDLANKKYIIDNTMFVYQPARFSGLVYDLDNEEPLNGVSVTAGPFQATTRENGEYVLFIDEGEYDIVFEKLGYIPVTVEDTSALKGLITTVSIGLWDMNYPPGSVQAEVLNNDSLLYLSWALPQGPYEIILDDGEADDFFIYSHAGSWNAVKFTPLGFPATVTGGKFYVGDGSFPGPFLGTEFGVAVFDDDGINGLPGTMLDSAGVTVNNSGWVDMDWLNAVITEGSFYLAMYQSGNTPFAAPIGIDTDYPTHFKSYNKFLSNNWSLSPLQDFMIRALISGPEGDGLSTQRAEETGNRDLTDFFIVRYADFDPDNLPTTGTMTELGASADLFYNDTVWDDLPQGWYAYGVKALYTSGLYSDYSISNIVGHYMDFKASFNTSLTTGLEPVNVEISLKGLDFPYETFFMTTPSSGSVVFDMVWKGRYNVTLFKVGYDLYEIKDVVVSNNIVFNVVLSEKKYAPTCLYVDPVSLEASWCEPLKTALQENFERPVFPPAGWQSLALCDTTGWQRAIDGSSSNWTIPAWDSYYAVYNDFTAGSDCNGCCEFLVTPALDLRESENFILTFDSYYDGSSGQLAFVEYSIDEGANWEVLNQLVPATNWIEQESDLGMFSGEIGPARIWLAFHADNAGAMGSGWAIDNVLVQAPAPAANYLDFPVFLNGAFVGLTTEPAWDYAPLAYGQTYTASVAARYTSGLSSKDYFSFKSKYLFPPRNLAGIAPDDAAILTWDPPESDQRHNLLGYNIYRDDVFIHFARHIGGWEPQTYVEEDLEPGIYDYTITGVYDLTPYGFPGETGESMEEGPAEVTVDYCHELEFMETWTMGNFEANLWVTDGDNWSIKAQAGNPAPSVEFTWDPVQHDYEISLESYPLCAVGMTEGTIWLDFDLALYAVQPSGEEFLLVQTWNWDSKTWITAATYSNAEGNFEWKTEHVSLRAQAMDMVFKIRFLAKGSNSLDIRSWFIDNIHIYRNCAAPEDLSVDPYFYDGIRLTWELEEYGNTGSENGTRDLQGFLIYRSVNGGDWELQHDNYQGMPYIDPDSNLVMGSLYCYKVMAAYESPTDYCESGFSNEACVVWTGIGLEGDNNDPEFRLFPNPAVDHVYIASGSAMVRVKVYNALGQSLLDETATGRQFGLNTAGFPAGVYIVQVQTASAVANSILTIQR